MVIALRDHRTKQHTIFVDFEARTPQEKTEHNLRKNGFLAYYIPLMIDKVALHAIMAFFKFPHRENNNDVEFGPFR